jgi:hypothetical protein
VAPLAEALAADAPDASTYVARALAFTQAIPYEAGKNGEDRGYRRPLSVLARGRDVRVTLTDLYPNTEAFAHAARTGAGRVVGRPAPLDATAVPPDLDGFRTVFSASYHLPPPSARKVLADAVAANKPIAVFEVVSREWPMLLGLLLAPLNVTLTVPFWRPFRWPWLFWTWVVPVMQPFVLWDGLVSWLRIYSEAELRALVADIPVPEGWVWDIGRVQHGKAPIHGTYLVGYPTRR